MKKPDFNNNQICILFNATREFWERIENVKLEAFTKTEKGYSTNVSIKTGFEIPLTITFKEAEKAIFDKNGKPVNRIKEYENIKKLMKAKIAQAFR